MYKGAVDLVTDFDRPSQDMIFRRLSAAFPDHGFLAEEGLSARGELRFPLDHRPPGRDHEFRPHLPRLLRLHRPRAARRVSSSASSTTRPGTRCSRPSGDAGPGSTGGRSGSRRSPTSGRRSWPRDFPTTSGRAGTTMSGNSAISSSAPRPSAAAARPPSTSAMSPAAGSTASGSSSSSPGTSPPGPSSSRRPAAGCRISKGGPVDPFSREVPRLERPAPRGHAGRPRGNVRREPVKPTASAGPGLEPQASPILAADPAARPRSLTPGLPRHCAGRPDCRPRTRAGQGARCPGDAGWVDSGSTSRRRGAPVPGRGRDLPPEGQSRRRLRAGGL